MSSMMMPSAISMIPTVVTMPAPPNASATSGSACVESSAMPPMMSKAAAMIARAATIVTPSGRFGPNWSEMALPVEVTDAAAAARLSVILARTACPPGGDASPRPHGLRPAGSRPPPRAASP